MNFQKFSPLLSAAAFLASSDFSSGQSIRWIGTRGAPGDFNDGANWAGGAVPGPGNEALIRNNPAGTITLSSPTEIQSLNVRNNGSATIVAGSGTPLEINGTTQPIRVRSAGASLTLTGDFALSDPGSVNTIRAEDGATLNIVGATVDSGLSDIRIESRNGGNLAATDSTFNVGQELIVTDFGSSAIEFNGTNTINGGGLTLEANAAIGLSPGDLLDVNGGTIEGGTWVLDVGAGGTGSDFIEAVDIDITNIHLDLTGNVTGSGPGNPRVLATYSGTLTQNGTPEGFASVTGLPSGLRLSFDNGQIALVPEMSLAAPILAGFLPLVAFRRRMRK